MIGDGIPAERGFATKPELAITASTCALDAGVPLPWVTVDAVYGQQYSVRYPLAAGDLSRALAMLMNQPVFAEGGSLGVSARLMLWSISTPAGHGSWPSAPWATWGTSRTRSATDRGASIWPNSPRSPEIYGIQPQRMKWSLRSSPSPTNPPGECDRRIRVLTNIPDQLTQLIASGVIQSE